MHVERRTIENKDQNIRLNMLQKVSMYTLQGFGYSVAFLRNTANGSLAFAFCGDNFVTIDKDGNVNQNPTETVRPL